MVRHGVDLERFSPCRYDRDQVRRALALGDRWTLLSAGRLTERKGLSFLLRALRRIKDTLPPFRLLVAGEGPAGTSLQRQAEAMDLSEHVFFMGARRDVPELL